MADDEWAWTYRYCPKCGDGLMQPMEVGGEPDHPWCPSCRFEMVSASRGGPSRTLIGAVIGSMLLAYAPALGLAALGVPEIAAGIIALAATMVAAGMLIGALARR